MTGRQLPGKRHGMKEIALVFAGAGLGGVLRYGVALGCTAACGSHFPWGTLMINIIGSLLMGVVVAWLTVNSDLAHGANLRLFLATGVLGGFTTFSAFSLDAVVLWDRGEALLALSYAGGSVVLSIAALVMGASLVRWLA